MSRTPIELDAEVHRLQEHIGALAQKAAQFSRDHRQMELMISLLPVAMWTTDAHLIITSAAGLTRSLLFREPEVLAGGDLATLLSHSVPGLAACRQAAAGRQARALLVSADRVFALHAAPFQTEDSSDGCFAVALDITDHHDAQQTLATSEARYRQLFESANDLIFRCNLEGRLTSISRSIERLLGFSPETAVTLNFRDLLAPEYQSSVAERMADMLAGGHSRTWEVIALGKDGRRIYLELHSRLIFSGGRPVGIEGIGRDVTERRILEEQVRQSQKMEAIGVLAGGIAHDFNNLLTGILGYSHLLQSEPGMVGVKASEALDVIVRSAERAAQLTTQLLGFARRGKSQNILVDLHNTIRDLVTLLERTIDKKVDLTTALKARNACVLGDPGQMYQVLLNLCLNARDAMPSGGELSIATRTEGEALVVTVSDNGTGIEPEIRDRIFEPFFTTKSPDKGTGLGLATVYGIVRSHGGTIKVTSTIGEGSSFEVVLPSAELGTSVVPRREEPQAGRGRILVIDDESIVTQVVTTMLESLGYQVVAFSDSREAVRYYDSHHKEIDVVILDMIMPHMNGRECFAALSAMNPNVRVILSSGYSRDDDAAVLLRTANVEFLQKPYQLEQIASAVRKALGKAL